MNSLKQGVSIRSASFKTQIYYASLLIVFLVGIGLRLAVPDIDRSTRMSDEHTYYFSAMSVLKHNVLTREVNGDMFEGRQRLVPTAALSPGYSIYLASIYALFDESAKAVVISQIALSLVALWFVYKILDFFEIRRRHVILTLTLTAVYPGFLYNLDRLLTEQLFTTLFLGFVFYFLSGSKENSLVKISVSAAFLALATHTRGQAFPFVFLVALVTILYPTGSTKRVIYNLLFFFGTFILFMAPWWIRNWLVFDQFIFLSTASEGPRVWGAMPYFIDMGFAEHRSLVQVLEATIPPNPWIYYKWRLFGFFQYMWGDVWDEGLAHAVWYLKGFLLIQYFVVVPSLIAIPFLVFRSRWEVLFLTAIPIAFTLMHLPFHGLPRYVYPSLPFVFVTTGLLLHRLSAGALSDGQEIFSRNLGGSVRVFFDVWIRRTYMLLTIAFAIIIAFSVYLFAFNINQEMSEYRLGRYFGISTKSLLKKDVVATYQYGVAEIRLENLKHLSQEAEGLYENNLDGPPVMRLGNIPRVEGQSRIVSKVTMNIQGGFFYDRSTIYWRGAIAKEMSENSVYSFPINRFSQHRSVYIDDDIDALLIVPGVFRGGEFKIDSVEVVKYRIPD